MLTTRGSRSSSASLLAGKVDVADLSDAQLMEVLELALAPAPPEGERLDRQESWNPIDLLVPEWSYLQREPLGAEHDDPSGLMLSTRALDPGLPSEVTRVLAVDKLRKVNALFGFTRVDAMDRVNDLPQRMAPLTRDRQPTWTVATEDHGEGIFLQLDEARVAAWEADVEASAVWTAHVQAHRRNYQNRYSETADMVIDPDVRMRPPRYWLLHTLAHLLIREMAMQCGYSAASLSERIYAWVRTPEPGTGGRAAYLHDRLRQRRNPRRFGPAQRTCPARPGHQRRPTPSRALLVRPDLRHPYAARS